ncbi:MAG: SDR family oxidoreductase, partial [Chloroflexi bacterium]|nr:SDR family oxidoreductase [Chloroflexota bacterium]
MTLENKVAIVTGGGRGIGEAIALRLAGDGAQVAVWDIRPELAEAVSAKITAMGRKALAGTVDVTKMEQVQQGCKDVVKRLGRIDILVNNAGWTVPMQHFKDLDPAHWRSIVDVDLFGVLNCTKVALEYMVPQKYGRIISITSDSAKAGSPGQSVYVSAKAGVMGFTRSLAAELGKLGITVNCVSPSSTDTALLRQTVGVENFAERERAVPVGRLGRP